MINTKKAIKAKPSNKYLLWKRAAAFLTTVVITASTLTPSVLAATDYAAEAEERKSLTIQSNETKNWPQGPQIGAEAAILMDVNSGAILYSKNIHEKLYPASTTKILTCLLAVENSNLDEEVSFSSEAVSTVPSDGSSIGIDVGESMSLESCLYGIMVGSANEVANAVAEHVSGSISDFTDLMNAKAKELGCTDSRFANPNGLFNENHYTSANDLALIACDFFKNELLCKIADTPTYHFTPTANQPDDFYLHNKHKLINGDITYEGIIGGKTGYTDEARETLVTCAQRGNMKLVCVILKEESPAQFTDTTALFDYGFNNFKETNVSDEDTTYIPDDSGFFESDEDIFGNSGAILSINSDSIVTLPQNVSLSDCTSTVSYDLSDEDIESDTAAVAKIIYSYNDVSVGSAFLDAASFTTTSSGFTTGIIEDSGNSGNETIYINILGVILALAILFVLVNISIFLYSFVTTYHFAGNQKDRRRYRRRKREIKKRGI